MLTSPALAGDGELEPVVQAVEARLQALGQALLARDAAGVEQCATELHRALTQAVDAFSRAARQGGIPYELRRRLASATGQVAAQRESLARATAALDRAMDVLMPREEDPVYGAGAGYGAAGRPQRSITA
ncbi:MAG TPA: hypothetical protein VNO84_14925 [Burkholderiaceae bacterium]|nr:hypothetical protein [Burkholderiaceae bacterium]